MNVIPLILAAGAGYVGYKVFLDKKQPAEAPKANPALGQVDRLEQGKSYTVIHATKRKELGDAAQALGLTPPDLIKKTMESAGFQFLSNPALKDPTAALTNPDPNTVVAWVYNVKRTTPEPYITANPPLWSGMVQFYQLPVT